MNESIVDKVLIVEGKSDKFKVKSIVKEPVEIICTNGTISHTKLDEWIDILEDKDVYILVDADEAGEKLRKLFKREFPNAEHLYIDRMYREVATAPVQHLAAVLIAANIDVHSEFLEMGQLKMNEWNHGEFAAFFEKRETGLVYFYTPMCGTCQLAGKMLQVVGMMKPDLVIGKINLNYHPDIARQFTIESVPCLLFVRDGVVVEAIYAFQSVPYLLEKIKLNFG